jgi:hypothetical protein
MRGQPKSLSVARALMTDLTWASGGASLIGIARSIPAHELAAARKAAAERIPWVIIFAKAFALTAEEFPCLRQVYLPAPWPHLYEYPASVASITVERTVGDEPVIINCRITDPGSVPLGKAGAILRYAVESPLEQIQEYRRHAMIGRLPWPLRRFLWWVGYNVGRLRANYFGTFTLSTMAAHGNDVLLPLRTATTFLSYDPLKDGAIKLLMWWDHRVYDGGTASRAIVRLAEIVNGPVLDELRSLAAHGGPPHPASAPPPRQAASDARS